MISRVAEHCFWLGRYLERAESTARVLAVTRNISLDGELPVNQLWLPVIIVSGEQATFEERFGKGAADDGARVQDYMTWDPENAASLSSSASMARYNARCIRETVSHEGWEPINELYLWFQSPEGRRSYDQDRHDFYRHVRDATQLTLGLLRSTMLDDTPLDFILLGMFLERVGQTARMLDVHHYALRSDEAQHTVVETALWLSLLRACSGFEPFMKVQKGRVNGRDVANFLIFEPRFPRGICFALRHSVERLARIRPPQASDLPGGAALERLKVLERWVLQAKADLFVEESVHGVLTRVIDETSLVCDSAGQELFGYGKEASQSQSQS